MRIAILSGRPADGTLLPKKEQYVWHEVCRILEEEMKRPVMQEATLLIPIYTKFDLQVLYYAEQNRIRIEYYVPSEDWGLSSLPKHQIELVARMGAPRNVFPSHTERIRQMVASADMVYVLPYTQGLDRFLPFLKEKRVASFPVDKMRYHTEEEAEAWHEKLAANTQIYLSQERQKEARQKKLDEEVEDFLYGHSAPTVPYHDTYPYPNGREDFSPDEDFYERNEGEGWW